MARVNCALDRSIKQHSLREIDFPFFFAGSVPLALCNIGIFWCRPRYFAASGIQSQCALLGFLKFLAGWGFTSPACFFIVTCSVPNLPLVMCSFRKVYVLVSLCNLCFTILIVSSEPVQHTFMFPLTSFYCRNRVQPNQLM